VYDVFPSTIAQAFEANNTQVLSRGVPCEFEEMVPHADGMRWYTSVKAPIADAAGRLAYVVGVSTDITERKQAEQEIQSLLQEAAQRERVLHEKQAQLLQAAKLASLGQIMTGVAHELNNPLNNIGLFVSNALDQIDSGMGGRGLKNPLSEQLRRALGEIHRAAQVIVHLRAFAGGHVAHGLVHDVNDIVRMAAAGVDARFRTDNITLILELTPMRLVLRGNEVLLKQTFMSVLMNAADAVTGGLMPEVRIRSYQEAGHALILVEDTGVGIPAEILPHIFDPFFTTKEVGKGTGLGLSTSYGIIQDHHGDLRVTSRPGQGTVVTVTLPLAHEGVV
jgi:C4-dicarboxylate-specific signal transduction histidine kinase